MAKLVFSYSHSDEELRNELEKHLSPLKRMGKIDAWHDRRIVPGEEFEGQIDKHFLEADIILLLVSSDFINSDYCFQVEMESALQRHDRGEAIVIPVILRPCAWHQLPFGKLLAATKDGKPVVQFPSYDEGFVQVVDAVSRALDQVGAEPSRRNPLRPEATHTSSSHDVTTPRSSNLAIPQKITDLDRDRACKEGFEYLVRFFDNSLEELKNRNSGLDIDFQIREADSFSCAIYQNGQKACQCGIWRNDRNSGLGAICYSQSGVSKNSCNESMTIDDNGQVIGFRPLMGGHMMSGNRDALMTNEGMAEHFWGMFISPLQSANRY
ncbi:toll/interleukin-1 receptor domain-containing protein [Halomonas sp. EGI 63088]|uniref:Toll/interleukin-1 receptor domain-containing protein n=1 Tax=Halomonas flagellata TaxID=2920385 RepID=A0ABS9RZI9_9GAMM|nr:toll/interleukin-1 receptor domain-containing protein [Halomonas flagellata]MCH4565270.1 toll/interleukin-1 receptor domain-containing protein [Halomonas flagellata]